MRGRQEAGLSVGRVGRGHVTMLGGSASKGPALLLPTCEGGPLLFSGSGQALPSPSWGHFRKLSIISRLFLRTDVLHNQCDPDPMILLGDSSNKQQD